MLAQSTTKEGGKTNENSTDKKLTATRALPEQYQAEMSKDEVIEVVLDIGRRILNQKLDHKVSWEAARRAGSQ